MRGTLLKTKNSWSINYLKDTMSVLSPYLSVGTIPLHPEDETYTLDSDMGSVIDFEIVKDNNVEYGKLTPVDQVLEEKINTECEDIWLKGFIVGLNFKK
jgi:hypothetical protein